MRKLNTPAKVQDFLNSLKFNFEKNGQTLKSPLFTLRKQNAHCIEGALLGAYILSLHKFTPYLLHLKTIKNDFDHVIAPFKINGLWGALSKTNHAVLRYREPVYKSIRELAMSYFHEWETMKGDLWGIDKELDKIKHYQVLPKEFIKKLRKADKVEIEAGKIVEYKK